MPRDIAIGKREMQGVLMMRPAVIIVIAVLIAALLAFDGYEYDGHYRAAAWDGTKQQIDQLELELEKWLGKSDH